MKPTLKKPIVKQIDRERVWLCDNCRRIIGMK